MNPTSVNNKGALNSYNSFSILTPYSSNIYKNYPLSITIRWL